MNVVCPKCDAVNRVPAERAADDPRCGKCGSPLLDGTPHELTAGSFARFVSRNDLPVLVDFWAPWCGPCKMMAPVFVQAAAQARTEARFAKVNTEQETALAAQYGIRSIPTLVLFRNGVEMDRVAGAMDGPSLLSWLRRH